MNTFQIVLTIKIPSISFGYFKEIRLWKYLRPKLFNAPTDFDESELVGKVI
jgi:hypothetical protein